MVTTGHATGVEKTLLIYDTQSTIHVALEESLHIILMTIAFFEINQLHSLGYRQMITKEKIYEKISSRVQLSYNIQ